MQFANISDQAIADQIVTYVGIGRPTEAKALLPRLTIDESNSERGLLMRCLVAITERNRVELWRLVETTLAEFPEAEWAVLLASRIYAALECEDQAISILKQRMQLEDWQASFVMAQNVVQQAPERGLGYLKAALKTCPTEQKEFLATSALQYPPLAAALQKQSN
jgi:hypothetical protein